MRMTTVTVRWALLTGLLLVPGAIRAQTYGVGSITGTITFPGEYVPALRVYAITTDGRPLKMIETPKAQNKFVLADLPTGQYHVVAYPYEKEASFEGVAWTKAARCIKGPCDHTLVPVSVAAGKIADGVLLADWYVPAAMLPPDPAVPREKAPAPMDCEKGKTAAERDGCHQRAQEAADRAINQHFERVMRVLERYPRCHEDLRNSQLAWLRFRDQHCAFESSMAEKGRLVRCLRELTENRAIYMQGLSALGCNK
jgi:uncharacterized protein YecT (DUF1311 family)